MKHVAGMINRTAVVWSVILVLAIAPAVFIFLFRADLLWFEYQQAAIGEVYAPPPEIGYRISGFELDQGRLTVRIYPADRCDRWQVSGPIGPVSEQVGPFPIIDLVPGRQEYRVTPQGCALSFDAPLPAFDIAYTPLAKVIETTVDHDLVNVYRTPLDVAPRSGPRLTRWIPPLEDHPAEEIARARTLLAEIGIKPEMSSLEKMKAVTAGILARATPGLPPPRLDQMSPMQVLDAALTIGIPIFCRQRALTKAFLLNVAGVPTRIVWVGRTLGPVILSSHAFTESYIEAQGRWAFSDLSHRLAYVTDADGRVLTALDVLGLASNGRLRGDTADWHGYLPPKGATTDRPDDNTLNSLSGVMNRNAILQYWGAHDRFVQQIKLTPLKTLEYRLRRYLFEPTLYIGPERGYTLHWLRALSVVVAALAVLAALGRFLWRHR